MRKFLRLTCFKMMKKDKSMPELKFYLSIFGKKRYPRFLAESRIVRDDRLSTLTCQSSTSVERTASQTFSLKREQNSD